MSPFTASVLCGQSELQTRQYPAAPTIHTGEADGRVPSTESVLGSVMKGWVGHCSII